GASRVGERLRFKLGLPYWFKRFKKFKRFKRVKIRIPMSNIQKKAQGTRGIKSKFQCPKSKRKHKVQEG
ncbi:MAG TPA: hypothetical protein VFV08_02225, partial [Puia sp.]|nr:hypothetical protein [Puia sp.]